MAIKHKSGRTKNLYLPKASAVTIRADGLLKFNGIGGVIMSAGSADTNAQNIGISVDSHATSDTTTNLIAVQVPLEFAVEWEFDTDSDGGLTDTMVGTFRDLDTNGTHVDVSSQTDNTILVTRVISSTKGVGIIARGCLYNDTPVQAST